MKRPTLMLERLILWLLVVSFTLATGFLLGGIYAKPATAQCLEGKKLQLSWPKKIEKRWINYWKTRS